MYGLIISKPAQNRCTEVILYYILMQQIKTMKSSLSSFILLIKKQFIYTSPQTYLFHWPTCAIA